MKSTDHDRTVTGRTDPDEPRLASLDENHDYKVAHGDPDIRGWEVAGADGRTAGEVKDLIIDTRAMKVRYMVVELVRAQADSAERQVLVPIGTARLDDDRDRVSLSRPIQLSALPAYRKGELTREHERALLGQYGAAGSTARENDAFYEHEHFEDRGFWGSRRAGRDDRSYLTRSEEELEVGRPSVAGGDANVRKERIEFDEHASKGRVRDEESRPR